MHRIKLIKVDRIARAKGYRPGMVLHVIGIDWAVGPKREALFIVQRRGCNPEGFYPDQFRVKCAHRAVPWTKTQMRSVLKHRRRTSAT